MSRKISIGFSPCPNDTFIFDALVNGRIKSEFVFQAVIADVEELNGMALKGMLEVTKLSYSAFFNVIDSYYMLRSGSALGNGVGPLLIAKNDLTNKPVDDWSVALPGKLTTAHLLFSLAYPQITKKSFMLFSDIENVVISDDFDAGVIIHENRFTYRDKGLHCIQDLGEFWESKYQVPVPLGGIAAKRSLPLPLLRELEELIRQSTVHAFEHPEDSREFVSAYAQEMDATVRQKHIDTYVNDYSVELGNDGENAIQVMGKQAQKLFQLDFHEKDLFLPPS